MTFRVWFLLPSIAVVGLGFIDLHPANAQTAENPANLTVKAYAVADLLVSKIDPRSGPKSREEAADQLIKAITAKVDKDSWPNFGGSAALRYFPNGMILVIRQSDAGHAGIAKLLAELRRDDPPGEDRPLRVVYPIADLIAPINDHSIMNDGKPLKAPSTRSKDEFGNDLAAIIRETIAEKSWAKGRGISIEYTPFGQALVVNQILNVQKQIETLLAELRRVQGLQVSFELRIFEVPPADRILKDLAKDGKKLRAGTKVDRVVITEIQHFMLLEALANDQKALMNVAPKLTVYNGQKAGIDARKNQMGLRYDVQPVASEDRKSVRVLLDFEYTLPEKIKGKARRVRLADTFNVPTDHTLVWHVGDLDGTHVFATATPRIILAEEEEKIFLREIAPRAK